MPHPTRFRKATSDRSGFDVPYRIRLKQGVWHVSPEEYDAPPPSAKSLGGEGDVNRGDRRTPYDGIASTDVPEANDHPVVAITAAGGITPTFTHAWMQVVGSNAAINITANPQIGSAKQSQVLTLECVGSSITLEEGSGLALMASAPFVMTSGAVIGLIYQTGGSVWQETFRTQGV